MDLDTRFVVTHDLLINDETFGSKDPPTHGAGDYFTHGVSVLATVFQAARWRLGIQTSLRELFAAAGLPTPDSGDPTGDSA